MNEIEKRYDSETKSFTALTVDKLVCKNCLFRYENPQLVTKCIEYDTKPPEVLYGGSCERYVKE